MNSAIAITFVIGGLFLISILTFNNQVQYQNQELLLHSLNNNSLSNLVEILENDFSKIGYKVGNAAPFSTIDSVNIIFKADVFDNDNFGSTDVQWLFDTSDTVTSTTNPNDFFLKRIGPIDTDEYATTSFPVVHFKITYFTANDIVTSDKSAVKKVEVEIIIEAAEPYLINKDNVQYPRLIWKRIFVPNNINLPY